MSLVKCVIGSAYKEIGTLLALKIDLCLHDSERKMQLFQQCISNNTSEKWDKIAQYFIGDWRSKLSGSTEQCTRLLVACPILC